MKGHRLITAGQLRGASAVMAVMVDEWFNQLVRAIPPPRRVQLRFYTSPAESGVVGYVAERSRGLVLALQMLDCQQCMGTNLVHEYAHVLDWPTSQRCGEDHGDGFYLHLARVDSAFYRGGRDR